MIIILKLYIYILLVFYLRTDCFCEVPIGAVDSSPWLLMQCWHYTDTSVVAISQRESTCAKSHHESISWNTRRVFITAMVFQWLSHRVTKPPRFLSWCSPHWKVVCWYMLFSTFDGDVVKCAFHTPNGRFWQLGYVTYTPKPCLF